MSKAKKNVLNTSLYKPMKYKEKYHQEQDWEESD